MIFVISMPEQVLKKNTAISLSEPEVLVKELQNMKIKEVNVYKDKNGKDKTVKVTFADDVSTVATLKEPDVFDLYTGIRICLEKYFLGNTVRNKLDNLSKNAVKAYYNDLKNKEKEKSLIEARKAKAEKKKAKRAARLAAKRATAISDKKIISI